VLEVPDFIRELDLMTLKKKLIAIGFAIALSLSVAACEVEEDPAVPEGNVNNVENTA
jgi:uncharacterized lipoprotein YehR (DUF1307 family)